MPRICPAWPPSSRRKRQSSDMSRLQLDTVGVRCSPGRWRKSLTPTMNGPGVSSSCSLSASFVPRRAEGGDTRRQRPPSPWTGCNGGKAVSASACGTLGRPLDKLVGNPLLQSCGERWPSAWDVRALTKKRARPCNRTVFVGRALPSFKHLTLSTLQVLQCMPAPCMSSRLLPKWPQKLWHDAFELFPLKALRDPQGSASNT